MPVVLGLTAAVVAGGVLTWLLATPGDTGVAPQPSTIDQARASGQGAPADAPVGAARRITPAAPGKAAVSGELRLPPGLLADGAEVQVDFQRLAPGSAMFRHAQTVRVAAGRVPVACDRVLPDPLPCTIRVEWQGLLLAAGEAIAAAAGAQVEVVLNLLPPPSRLLEVRHADGRPAGGLVLRLRPTGDPPGRAEFEATTDAGGSATVSALPGAYEVLAGSTAVGRVEAPRHEASPAPWRVQLPPPRR